MSSSRNASQQIGHLQAQIERAIGKEDSFALRATLPIDNSCNGEAESF